jgi:hypothetical protein
MTKCHTCNDTGLERNWTKWWQYICDCEAGDRLEDNLPKDTIQIEKLLKFKQYLPTQSLMDEYDTILQSLLPKHTEWNHTSD